MMIIIKIVKSQIIHFQNVKSRQTGYNRSIRQMS